MDRSEYEAQVREQQHQEDVLRRLADASTPEGVVAQKAYRRLGELLEELKLDEGHMELATQAGCSLSTCTHARPYTQPQLPYASSARPPTHPPTHPYLHYSGKACVVRGATQGSWCTLQTAQSALSIKV